MDEQVKIHCGECVHGMLWGRMDGGSRTRGTTCMLLGPQWSTRDVTECSEYLVRGQKAETISERVESQVCQCVIDQNAIRETLKGLGFREVPGDPAKFISPEPEKVESKPAHPHHKPVSDPSKSADYHHAKKVGKSHPTK